MLQRLNDRLDLVVDPGADELDDGALFVGQMFHGDLRLMWMLNEVEVGRWAVRR